MLGSKKEPVKVDLWWMGCRLSAVIASEATQSISATMDRRVAALLAMTIERRPGAETIMRWRDLETEPCSVARTISVIGDRWTLLILRDCFLRVRRFDDFQARLGVTRHLLADRLRRLVTAGVLTKVEYQERPRRFEYRLTQKGLDLYPALMAIVSWGDTYMCDTAGPPLLYEHKACGKDFHPVMTCSECGEPVGARDVHVHVGDGAAAAQSPDRRLAR